MGTLRATARRGCSGFSLVELLVVILIVSILAAFLLPTIQATLLQARLTTCAANLRQHYLGYSYYGSDFRDHMPAPADGMFANRIGTLNNPYDPSNGRFTPRRKMMNSGVFYSLGYFKDAAIYLCPDNPISYEVLPSSRTDLANLQANLDAYDQTGQTLADGLPAITYIHRGPRYTYDEWARNIDYYYAYQGVSASRLANNCAGAQLGRSSKKLPSAVALMADLPPYGSWAASSSPHGKEGMAVLYADGLTLTKRARPEHPFMEPSYDLGSAQFGGKLWGLDVYHPEFDPAGWAQSRDVFLAEE